MNVLHVIPAVAPRYGGPSTAVLGMCRALAAGGTTVTIATTDADGAGSLGVERETVQTYAGVRAIFFDRVDERFKYSPRLSRWLRRNVASFDVVHVHAVFSHSSVAAARACQRLGVPYVLRPLGSLDPWGLGRFGLEKRILRWIAVDRMITHAAAVHFTTDDEQRLARRAVPVVRGVVVPLGVADEMLLPPVTDAGSRDNVVAAIGRLHPVKNLEAVITAFASATAGDDTGWRLVIAGDGDPEYVDRLRSLARATVFPDRVEFPGWLDAGARLSLLNRCSLFVQASHQESFGISLAEALARGVPVIASRGVNLASEVERAAAGWVTEPAADAIAAVMRQAMSRRDEIARRATAALALASRFAWPRIAFDLQCLYAGVIWAASRRRPAPEPAAAARNATQRAGH